jgi:predicted nucleic acid-binding Zn ribbon protein
MDISRQKDGRDTPVYSKMALRALQEWRLLPGRKYQRPEKTLSSRVHVILKGLGLEEQFTEQELNGAWKELVGDFVAQNARPGSMKRGVLEIRVLQPSVLYMLEREMKGVVLAKLQQRFGSDRVRGVRFKIG